MANQKKLLEPTKTFGTRLKMFVKENCKPLLFMLFLFIINLAFLSISCSKRGITLNNKLFIALITSIFIINIILCAFILFVQKKSWPTEKIFLIVGTVLGLVYLFAIPMGRVPDEPSHIWRVFSISQGDVLTEKQDDKIGNRLPENVGSFGNDYNQNAYRELFARSNESISKEETFKTTISSSPIDYFPQSIGMLIGRILNTPLIVTFYLARLFGLAFCIIIVYFCIKFIPVAKKVLFFISCLPLSMQTFIGISYDSVIFCSAIILITFILYARYKSSFRFKPVHFIMLAITCLSLIAAKPVYFPLCLLLFFLPTRCFNNKKWKSLLTIAVLLVAILGFLVWASLSVITSSGNNADTGGQISFILSNPFKFIVILIHNILNMPILYFYRLGDLEWLDIRTDEFYVLGTCLFFVLLCVKEYITPSVIVLSRFFRYFVAISGIACVILIFTGLYIQWTPVGVHIVEGVQTRYLLPIAIIVPLLCSSSNESYKHQLNSNRNFFPSVYTYSFIIFLNINAVFTLISAHV